MSRRRCRCKETVQCAHLVACQQVVEIPDDLRELAGSKVGNALHKDSLLPGGGKALNGLLHLPLIQAQLLWKLLQHALLIELAGAI